ncbi:hypothetical protein HORIV_54470 [Vreelandella olivaria]|uniref:FAD linked oxidase N-terminal domain-containing protein n=1 Tax=Vreelandella olivaria TaxID=390919 RepID=A0ABM7GQD1_9GAMM|nr:hypothetical protein HORIV_54470 [Halomonas olivaria]
MEGQALQMAEHSGIVSYDPVELVVTVRAGTRLSELQQVLAEKHQMLGFEPPMFGEASTIGGAVLPASPAHAAPGQAQPVTLCWVRASSPNRASCFALVAK